MSEVPKPQCKGLACVAFAQFAWRTHTCPRRLVLHLWMRSDVWLRVVIAIVSCIPPSCSYSWPNRASLSSSNPTCLCFASYRLPFHRPFTPRPSSHLSRVVTSSLVPPPPLRRIVLHLYSREDLYCLITRTSPSPESTPHGPHLTCHVAGPKMLCSVSYLCLMYLYLDRLKLLPAPNVISMLLVFSAIVR
jgi:hypothetical protein